MPIEASIREVSATPTAPRAMDAGRKSDGPGNKRPRAMVVMTSGRGNVSNVATTAEEPAFHIGAIHVRALARLGYDVCATGSQDPGALLRETISFARRFQGTKLAVIAQGYGTTAAALRGTLCSRPAFVYHTWKVPFTGPARISARMMDTVADRVIRRAALVVLNSMTQQRQIAERYPRVPSIWAPVTADIDWWRPGPVETDLPGRLNLPAQQFLMCVGDIDRDEELPVALAQRLARPLVRVTRDPKTAQRALEASARAALREGHVLVDISWAQLRDLYRSAWAVLLAPVTSLHPAGLNGLTETMACGTPVLFPRGPTAEGYVQDGADGVLFDELTVDCVAAAAGVYAQPESRQRIAAAARATCQERLNFDTAAGLLVERLTTLGYRIE